MVKLFYFLDFGFLRLLSKQGDELSLAEPEALRSRGCHVSDGGEKLFYVFYVHALRIKCKM